MISDNKPSKHFIRSATGIVVALCCFVIILFIQSCKNYSSEKTSESLETSSNPCTAVKELAQKREKKAIEPLINLIKRNEDKQIQKCAAEELAKIDVDKSINILISSLNDDDLIASSRVAFALGVIKDKRAIPPLLTALFESNIPCPAAKALGMINDISTLEPLIKAAHHQDSSIRGCAVQAIAFYNDTRVCETLSDVFMTDEDKGVQFMARSSMESLKCSTADKQSTKYAIADKYCRFGQQLIDLATPLLENTKGLKDWQTNEWQKSQEWKNVIAENFQQYDKPVSQRDEGEKDLEMKLAIYTLVTEWGNNVVHYRLASDGKIMPEEIIKSQRLSGIKDKTEKLHQLCPNLKIPDYE